ncbi:MAG TPA: hypothetical protein VL357_02365 [Rariglobus sp.]|nr:hypothetical protein [Rariglobus sp.]
MKLTWKVICVFVGIFAAGAVTGVFLGARIMHHRPSKPVTADQFWPQQMKKFTEQLDLTPAQRDKIRPILKQTADDLRRTRKEAFKATTDIFERMETNIAKELTDFQRARLAEMQAEERERRKQWLADRAKQHSDNHSPGGPDGDDARRGPPPPPSPDAPSSDAPQSAPAPVAVPVTP